MIKHSNIIYMPHISELGGIETYVYEMVKKYHYLDIAVVSKKVDPKQALRIRKYCKLYIFNNETIDCDVCIINYDQSIIDYIVPSARIYQTIHADYTKDFYLQKPKSNPRITGYIAITKYLEEKMNYLGNMILSYNPLTIEEHKFLTLVSATRLHEHKGSKRMLKLANALNALGIEFIWYVITNDTNVIQDPNIIFIKPRLDIYKFLNIADYVVLLSDSEACSYTLNEALYRNIPIISTPLPYLEEIGVKDGVNSYIVDFGCNNVLDVASKMVNIPKFSFNKLEDNYMNILTDKISFAKEDRNLEVKIRCKQTYYDMELQATVTPSEDDPNYERTVSRERAELLDSLNLITILGTVKEEKEEKKVLPKIKEEKAVKRK